MILQMQVMTAMVRIEDTAEGARLWLRVEPRSSADKIAGPHNGALKIKITSPPLDGKANQHVIKMLAGILRVSRRQIEIISGTASKNKHILIKDVNAVTVQNRLGITAYNEGI